MLSKSDYLLYLKHPAWVWLKKHEKGKLPPVDANLQAIFDAGHNFEPYAESLFPGIVKLGFGPYEEYLSLPTRTDAELKKGTKIISQGRFEAEGITCICDIVVKVSENTLNLYEIKSSSKVKLEHLPDLAFQKLVLEASGYKVQRIFVIHLNNSYVRAGKIDSKQITTTEDVTEKVKEKLPSTKAGIKKALAIIKSSKIPDISPSRAKGTNALKDWLTIYRNLKEVDTYSIYDLFYAKADTIGKLEKLKIDKLTDIPDDFPLNDKQNLQVTTTKTNQEIIKKDRIKNFLSQLTFPLYFLDYETLSSIIPYFDGIRPNQQLPFQYSLHTLDSPKGKLRHNTYLHKENSNPAEKLSESLRESIGSKGSILVWNESFEKSCNKSLETLVPAFTSFYEDVNKRIVDLMIPFSEGWYVHKDFGGSASIKNVLPVLVPELSYKELGVQEGKAAQRVWMETVLDGKRESDKAKILSDLDKYCKLDTLAMVEIYKRLLKLST